MSDKEKKLGDKPLTIDQLVRWVNVWYVNIMNNLMTARHLPTEVPLTVRLDPKGEIEVLEGRERDCFLAGIEFAITQIGELPFTAVKVDAESGKPVN